MSSPLPEAQLPAMLRTTLAAYEAADANEPVKVVRLRYFAGMPQGVIVYGEQDTRQLAFNTETGETASLSGPGYPRTGQTFGWQGDQILKGFHRGDFIGMPGRWLSLITGLALLFLSISGGVYDFDLRRKQKSGTRCGCRLTWQESKEMQAATKTPVRHRAWRSGDVGTRCGIAADFFQSGRPGAHPAIHGQWRWHGGTRAPAADRDLWIHLHCLPTNSGWYSPRNAMARLICSVCVLMAPACSS